MIPETVVLCLLGLCTDLKMSYMKISTLILSLKQHSESFERNCMKWSVVRPKRFRLWDELELPASHEDILK